MTKSSVQAPAAVVMVRPHRFTSNPETASDNAFQRVPSDDAGIAERARQEVTKAAERLRSEGVRVHLFEDYGDRETPDSVFPNNWFSTHAGGHVAIYPMFSPSRRRERRPDVIEMLKSEYRVQDVIDYSGLEYDNLFLEGTGAMVFDHIERVAYTARSNRANPIVLERFATHFNFEPMEFETSTRDGAPVYHTNVLMTVATDFALVCFDLFTDKQRAAEVRERLAGSGREVIDLSISQIEQFAGNGLELQTPTGRVLALSTTAAAAISAPQREIIEASARIVALDVPTIELAGGSVRCMLAGIHLLPRH